MTFLNDDNDARARRNFLGLMTAATILLVITFSMFVIGIVLVLL
jgi:hypothetical protein